MTRRAQPESRKTEPSLSRVLRKSSVSAGTWLAVLMWAVGAHAQLPLPAYTRISPTVSRGTYYAPNYLKSVNTAVGGEGAYRMLQGVLKDHYSRASTHFGRDNYLVYSLRKGRSQVSRRLLLGRYAEDRFVAMNRDQGWHKVKGRFAPQRDVWRRVNGRIEYGQIKVHGLGRTSKTLRDLGNTYIRSMRKDSGRGQASLFLVPDDHVDVVKEQLSRKRGDAVRSGNSAEVRWLDKQRARLKPLGADYATHDKELTLGAEAAKSRVLAKWVGHGLTISFLLVRTGHDFFRWHKGELSDNGLLLQVGRTGTSLVVGQATNYLVAKSARLMNKPLAAGGVIAGVLFLAEQGWLIYEFRGIRNARNSPFFWVRSGANLGAASLGVFGAIGGAKLGMEIGVLGGPKGVVIGGVIGSTVGGLAGAITGYWGGRT